MISKSFNAYSPIDLFYILFNSSISTSLPLSLDMQANMKKSTSLKVDFSHLVEEMIMEARRSKKMREGKSVVRMTEDDDDVQVDSKVAQ